MNLASYGGLLENRSLSENVISHGTLINDIGLISEKSIRLNSSFRLSVCVSHSRFVLFHVACVGKESGFANVFRLLIHLPNLLQLLEFCYFEFFTRSEHCQSWARLFCYNCITLLRYKYSCKLCCQITGFFAMNAKLTRFWKLLNLIRSHSFTCQKCQYCKAVKIWKSALSFTRLSHKNFNFENFNSLD